MEPFDIQRARDAHSRISHTPEDRAKEEEADYYAHLAAVRANAERIATTEAQRETLTAELGRYAEGYRTRLYAALDAKSRTASAFIVGPANFPTRSNEKRKATERRRYAELEAWSHRAQSAIGRAIRRAASPQPRTAPDAPERPTSADTVAEDAQIRAERDHDAERLRLYFAEKPAEEIRTELRANGWKWAPTVQAWQRQTTNAAEFALWAFIAKHHPAAIAPEHLAGPFRAALPPIAPAPRNDTGNDTAPDPEPDPAAGAEPDPGAERGADPESEQIRSRSAPSSALPPMSEGRPYFLALVRRDRPACVPELAGVLCPQCVQPDDETDTQTARGLWANPAQPELCDRCGRSIPEPEPAGPPVLGAHALTKLPSWERDPLQNALPGSACPDGPPFLGPRALPDSPSWERVPSQHPLPGTACLERAPVLGAQPLTDNPSWERMSSHDAPAPVLGAHALTRARPGSATPDSEDPGPVGPLLIFPDSPPVCPCGTASDPGDFYCCQCGRPLFPVVPTYAAVLGAQPPTPRGLELRNAERKIVARHVRDLLKELNIHGVSVTAPSHSMAQSIHLKLPPGPSHEHFGHALGMVNLCGICSHKRAAQRRLEALILAAYPDLDNRSDYASDYHDYRLSIN